MFKRHYHVIGSGLGRPIGCTVTNKKGLDQLRELYKEAKQFPVSFKRSKKRDCIFCNKIKLIIH